MKKTMAFMILMLTCINISFAALTVNWGSGDIMPVLGTDPLGNSPTSGWLVQLYRASDVGNNLGSITGFDPINFQPLEYGADEVLAGSAFSTEVIVDSGFAYYFRGFGSTTWTSVAGESVYTVVFNASSLSEATYAMILDVTPLTLPESGEGYNYTLYGSGGDAANNWVPVPEPGTIMLGLAGIAILGNKLRKRGKKA